MAARREQARAYYAGFPPADRINARLVASWCKHLFLVSGVAYERQADAAGISAEQLVRAVDHPAATIEAKYALALLDMDLPATRVRRSNLFEGDPVPATATARRIKGMMAQGFGRMAIVSRLGMTRTQTISDWCRQANRSVPGNAAQAVAILADLWHNQDGGNRNVAIQSARAGYMPLSAWDGVDIADPDAEPTDSRTWLEVCGLPAPTPIPPKTVKLIEHGVTALCMVDPTVIYRTLAGSPPSQMTTLERMLVVRDGSKVWPEGPEMTVLELGYLLGTTDRWVQRIRARLQLLEDVFAGRITCSTQARSDAVLLGTMRAPYGYGLTDSQLARLLGMSKRALRLRRRQVLIDARRLVAVAPGSKSEDHVPADDGFDPDGVKSNVHAGAADPFWQLGVVEEPQTRYARSPQRASRRLREAHLRVANSVPGSSVAA